MSYYNHIELTEEEQKLRDKLVAMFLSKDYSNMLLGIEMLKQQKGELWLETIGRLFRIMYYLFHFEDDQPEKTYGYKFNELDKSKYNVNYNGRYIGHWTVRFVSHEEVHVFLPRISTGLSIVFKWHDYLDNDDLEGWSDWDLVEYISVGLGNGRATLTYSDEGRWAEQVCDDFVAALEVDIRKIMGQTKTV